MPLISVIQVCKSRKDIVQGGLEDFQGVREVLIIEGQHPARARNKAASIAKGEILLFIDDDCVLTQETIDGYRRSFEDEKTHIVGGPALIRRPHELAGIFASLCGSPVAFGPSHARYTPIGHMRRVGERELILCNLAFRKETFLESGGFNEEIFPGEENELLQRLSDQKLNIYYDPKLVVTRSMVTQFDLFILKIFRYSFNRAFYGKLPSFHYYLPLILVLFLFLSPWFVLIRTILAVYGGFMLLESIRLSVRNTPSYKKIMMSWLLLISVHVTYGVGLLLGLLKFLSDERFRHLFYTRHRVNNLK